MSYMTIYLNMMIGEFASASQDFCSSLEGQGRLLNDRPSESGWYFLSLGPRAATFRHYDITPDHPLEMNPTWKLDNKKRLKLIGPFTRAEFLRYVADRVEMEELDYE